MGWTPPDGIDVPRKVLNIYVKEASMNAVTTIGLDIAKNIFHAHGSDSAGRKIFSRRITRGKLLKFFEDQPHCLVAMEACGGAHHWAREVTTMGHEVRLIPAAYVKSYEKRQKNDAADSEAICEAVQRPSMRFVAIKSEEQQASALVFRTRDLLVRQRTQTINAIRGHMTEYGWVAPKGPSWMKKLGDLIEDQTGSALPQAARNMFRIMLGMLDELDCRIADLDKEITRRAREDEVVRRLLIIGASAVVRHANSRGAPQGSWLARMLLRKPRMLVTVAQANKTARIVWALLVKKEDYKAPVVATA